MKLVLATRNKDKKRELAEMLADTDIEVVTLEEYPECPEVIEDGETFFDNARKKALEVAAFTGEMVLADDSGLVVDSLGGEPGVHSARYGKGDDSTYDDNIDRLLKELESKEDRSAYFICVAVIAKGDKVLFECEGRCYGTILHERKGAGGFGYDPVFYYEKAGLTFGEMKPEEKNKVSHRAKALESVKDYFNS